MLVGVLISVMIAIVVGVNLIPTIIGVTTNLTEEAGEGTAVSTLMGILPYIFVAVILIGVVAWLGGSPFGDSDEKKERREKVKQFFGNAREVILRIEESSESWEQYINNLDELLGIKTVVAKNNQDVPGLVELNGLYLNTERELWIDKSYDWYIADKHPERDVFKLVGLHKKDASQNRVYILGADHEGGTPYLKEVPAETYLEASCEYCLKYLSR